uniref:Uncharacterized protein n=1 Tax=Meloidogyne javanica TaxID=6303 RepID=A0A915LK55_MELJA
MNLKFIFVACLAAAIVNENNALECYSKGQNNIHECFGSNTFCLTMRCGKHIVAKCCTNDPNKLCKYNKTDCKNKCAGSVVSNVEDPTRPKPQCPDVDSCTNDWCNNEKI